MEFEFTNVKMLIGGINAEMTATKAGVIAKQTSWWMQAVITGNINAIEIDK